jgi:hypothetical protein
MTKLSPRRSGLRTRDGRSDLNTHWQEIHSGRHGYRNFSDSAAGKGPIGEALYFPQGIERMTLGEIEFRGAETPMSRPALNIIEWIAADVPNGTRGFKLTFGKRDESTCFDAVFKTSGFTLKAPEIRIVEKDDSVRIIFLNKVHRSAANTR